MQESGSIEYSVIAKTMSFAAKSYHTIKIVDGKVVVYIYLRGSVSERAVNFYRLSHEERIQTDIKDKLEKQKLPKLPKAPIEPKVIKKPAPLKPLHPGSFVEESFYCARCNKYSYKGYLLENGSYICRDCKNLERNPNPKPRLVFQPIESGKRR